MSPAKPRLEALDALRGLIMVIMAMDHASYFVAGVHPFEFWTGPPPQYIDTGWFFTRWLTHLCAPGFFFLMGAGIILFAESRRSAGWSESKIKRQLILRGLLLIPVFYFIELPAFALQQRITSAGSPPGVNQLPYLLIIVLVCLGVCMALSAPLLRLSSRSWLAIGFISIMAPNFYIPTLHGQDQGVGYLMRILIVPGASLPLLVGYPILPWFGICALGLGFGHMLVRNSERALRALMPMGFAYLIAFVAVRIGGGFGNLVQIPGNSLVNFLTVIKYPPSLAFCLLMLGLNFVLLSLLFRAGPSFDGCKAFLRGYGQAPLFFYLAHMWVYFLMGRALAPLGGTPRWLYYAGWLAGVLLLYPACRWYRSFKASKPVGSLWRVF